MFAKTTGDQKSTQGRTVMQPVLEYMRPFPSVEDRNVEARETEPTENMTISILPNSLYDEIRLTFKMLEQKNANTPQISYTADLFKPPQVNTGTVRESLKNLIIISMVFNAVGHKKVVDEIRSCGLRSIADRLDYLRGLPVDYANEKPIELESLRKFARFIIRWQLSTPTNQYQSRRACKRRVGDK